MHHWTEADISSARTDFTDIPHITAPDDDPVSHAAAELGLLQAADKAAMCFHDQIAWLPVNLVGLDYEGERYDSEAVTQDRDDAIAVMRILGRMQLRAEKRLMAAAEEFADEA